MIGCPNLYVEPKSPPPKFCAQIVRPNHSAQIARPNFRGSRPNRAPKFWGVPPRYGVPPKSRAQIIHAFFRQTVSLGVACWMRPNPQHATSRLTVCCKNAYIIWAYDLGPKENWAHFFYRKKRVRPNFGGLRPNRAPKLFTHFFDKRWALGLFFDAPKYLGTRFDTDLARIDARVRASC